MTTSHDRALIMFASDVLAILEDNEEWSAGTADHIGTSARVFGLSTLNELHEFTAVPRSQFTNPLMVPATPLTAAHLTASK